MEVDKKQVVVVGIDDSEHGLSALQWTVDHLIVPFLPESPTKLLVVHAKPSPVSVLGGVGPEFSEEPTKSKGCRAPSLTATVLNKVLITIPNEVIVGRFCSVSQVLRSSDLFVDFGKEQRMMTECNEIVGRRHCTAIGEYSDKEVTDNIISRGNERGRSSFRGQFRNTARERRS
ncbi:hypothetical protein CRG98_047416 [Punica granatum]|uniref:UspA domain-containing protein n=1 Tax=Punica granatum TaxID=22663 RepID=A0A2I0HL31_PUNGR|nr:hypothetical protein CRG98_047416 [Punica granatum]